MDRSRLPWLLSAWACVACTDDAVIQRVFPRIRIEPRAVDFGEVPVGLTRLRTVAVDSIGTADLKLTAVTATGAFDARIGSMILLANESRELELGFSPDREGAFRGQVQIASNAEGAPLEIITLTGVGVIGEVSIAPRAVDFTATDLETMRSIDLIIDNRGAVPVSGPVVPLHFARPDAFALGGANLLHPPRFSADPSARTVSTLVYSPTVAGDDSGRLMFELCGDRCGLRVDVAADAGAGAIRATPAAIDFGVVGIGQPKAEIVTLKNEGQRPIEILQLTTDAPETRASSSRPLPITLAPGAVTVVSVEYTPLAASEMVGQLVISTSDPHGAQVRVRLGGRGAGPLIEVRPEMIDFGALYQVATQRRTFVVVNAGGARVRLTRVSFAGHSSFTLVNVPGLPVTLDPGATMIASVEHTPTGTIGRYLGEVTLGSDEVADLEVPVHASFFEPRCRLEAGPNPVNFGILTLPATATIAVDVTNRGVGACSLTGGEFIAPIAPAFSVAPVAWPIVLAPGQSARLLFSYAPTNEPRSNGRYKVYTDEPAVREHGISLGGAAVEPEPPPPPDAGVPDGSPSSDDGGADAGPRPDTGPRRPGPQIVPEEAGRFLYYWQISTSGTIMRLPLQGVTLPVPYRGTRTGHGCVGCHSVSPDGRYVAMIQLGLPGYTIVDNQTGTTIQMGSGTSLAAWNPNVNTNPPYQFATSNGRSIQLYSVTAGQLNEVMGTRTLAGALTPSWGPNGKIAFARPAGAGIDLMLIDEGGGTAVPVAGASNDAAANWSPAFSPDGRWLAYTRSPTGNGFHTTAMSRIQLVRTDQSGTVRALNTLNSRSGSSSYPTWSHDGRFLSFSSDRRGGEGSFDIYIAPIDGVSGSDGPAQNMIELNTRDFEHNAFWSP